MPCALKAGREVAAISWAGLHPFLLLSGPMSRPMGRPRQTTSQSGPPIPDGTLKLVLREALRSFEVRAAE